MINNIDKTDFYIKLNSEADLPTALSAFYNTDGELVQYTADYAMHIVGIIWKQVNDTPEFESLDGYHINIRLINDTHRADVEALFDLYGIEPKTPSCVWA